MEQRDRIDSPRLERRNRFTVARETQDLKFIQTRCYIGVNCLTLVHRDLDPRLVGIFPGLDAQVIISKHSQHIIQ